MINWTPISFCLATVAKVGILARVGILAKVARVGYLLTRV